VILGFKKAPKAAARAGIVATEQTVALAVVQRRVGQRPVLQHSGIHEVADGKLADCLPPLFSGLSLGRTAINAVIGNDDYQLVQVEQPEVLPSELRAAVRWRLRDMINFHIDDAVVDVFEIPDQSRRSQNKMMFAVAARSAAVQHLVSALAAASRGFDVIDIPELCLRNLSSLLPQDQNGVALIALGERSAHLVLTRQGVLYLARRIDLGRHLQFEAGNQSGKNAKIDPGALALELQRSLDYYESHYDQAAIGDLVIAPADARGSALATGLTGETNLRVTTLALDQALELAPGVEPAAGINSLMALGAALRMESTPL
jgi:MSHA biogenesis protein MshI